MGALQSTGTNTYHVDLCMGMVPSFVACCSREEMEQLTINLVFKLNLTAPKDDIDERLKHIPDLAEEPMNF